jgi:argininosuccinate lyase
MWAGRTDGSIDEIADEFNRSISFDCRMFAQDIRGSIAHACMLGAQGIISKEDMEAIIEGLDGIRSDIESGALEIDMTAEDIHMFIEAELTKRIGDAGKRLHTARSRNDQVALDLRLYLRDEVQSIIELITELVKAITDKADEYRETIMPGYTHLQRAQPITFGHHLMAYASMFMRDVTRLMDASARMNISPLGSCALAGTTYDTDRTKVAAILAMDGVCENSLDGVSDRDFAIEICSALAVVMMHVSRFSEEIILWSSWEFKFVELDDRYTTGSSIMPQKKNSDMAELARGKSARVYGDLMALLTLMKGLPLAYNKDMQEDKEAIFDAIDTVKITLKVFAPMIATMKALPDNMYKAAGKGFINATDAADYLTRKGVPFRDAYKATGKLVARCLELGCVLDDLDISEFKAMNSAFEEDIYNEISLKTCVEKRISYGGTSFESVKAQIASAREFLAYFSSDNQ